MQAMMKQMGISQDSIDATRVIIETSDKKIIIEEPEVQKINMQGSVSFQISGNIKEAPLDSDDEDIEENTEEEDLKTIIDKTGCNEEEAKKALEDSNGDLTEAILSLS